MATQEALLKPYRKLQQLWRWGTDQKKATECQQTDSHPNHDGEQWLRQEGEQCSWSELQTDYDYVSHCIAQVGRTQNELRIEPVF